jgi:hypothetical protein
MRSLASGLFERLAAPDALWHAYREVRSGKRRGPVMAAYEREADRDILALNDFVLFANDADTLRAARARIADWLARERALALNPAHNRIEHAAEPAVFLGYRISRGGIGPSRRLRRRLRARIRVAAAHGPEALRRTLVSYRGLLRF